MLPSNDVCIQNIDGFVIVSLNSNLRKKLLKLFGIRESKVWFVNVREWF